MAKKCRQNEHWKGKNRRLRQSSSSYANYEDLSSDEDVGKDFGVLVNAPISKGGHFVFKSEKLWSVDTSQYSEFFTLNLRTLSAAIDCIPFNECIDVDDKYFTSDQLTSIHNDAEKGKIAYSAILNDLNASSAVCPKPETSKNTEDDQSKTSKLTTNTKLQSDSSTDNLEEDIDFLLSLKEPVQRTLRTTQPVSMTQANDYSKIKPKDASTKPLDLEKWLDSVLED
ncbi:uncharacterized protein LOC109853126 [Pseudomyrmex gracilis]|uniref:uncharacterized protein LOC109853126 n=1 Tax=Pseudomyrmex gracilis TaxID=219809 RepID=UPI0009952FCC|nr:uncharacterized protein LOC109853126 [Pseudomyrmex gracilis]